MNEWVRRALPGLYISAALLFTGAAAVTGAAAAQAADGVGNSGVGNGNQVQAPITVPINVCGNAVGVLGNAEASCEEAKKEKKPPVKPSPTVTPSESASPSPTASPSSTPGGGGSELPRTGASVGWLISAATLLVGAGVGLIALARRRVRRGLHAA